MQHAVETPKSGLAPWESGGAGTKMAGLEDIIRRQWPALKNRVADLENRKRLLQAELRELDKELERAEQEFIAVDQAAKTLQINLALQLDIDALDEPKFTRLYKSGEVSIKQAARLVLAVYNTGLNSRDLFTAINRRYFEGKLDRTSFSPQLSRLKADGEVEDREVVERDHRWVLTEKGRKIMGKGPILPYRDEPDTNGPPSA